MGSGRFAIPVLDALAASEHRVLAAVTQPDRPSGRGQRSTPTPVAEHAEAKGVFLYQPEDVGAYEFMRALRALSPELIVVADYGQFLTREILEMPTYGCTNVHPSLLPRWRGAAPVARAILHGDRSTGVTVHRLVEKMDAGEILGQLEEEIRPADTAPALEERLAGRAGPLVLEVLKQIAEGTVRPRRQDERKAVVARKFDKREGEICWKRPARQVEAMVRAMQPYPGAYTRYHDLRLVLFEARAVDGGPGGEPGTVTGAGNEGIQVRCADGQLLITRLQPENRREMTAQEFLTGHAVQLGEKLSSGPFIDFSQPRLPQGEVSGRPSGQAQGRPSGQAQGRPPKGGQRGRPQQRGQPQQGGQRGQPPQGGGADQGRGGRRRRRRRDRGRGDRPPESRGQGPAPPAGGPPAPSPVEGPPSAG